MTVYPANAFGSLNKYKANFYISYLHAFHQVPVNIILVVRYINTMDQVIVRNGNTKFWIGNKITGVVAVPPPGTQ